MAKNAVSLGIQITADDAELRAVMKRASEATTAAFGQMSRSADTFKTALAGLGVGISAGYFINLINGAIEAKASMADFAEEAGTTASAMSRFEAPARMAGLEIADVATAMFRLNKAALEAKDPTSKAAQAFNALGISAAQLKGIKPDEMFELIARSADKYSAGLEKNAVMQELLGKSGQKMNRVMAEIATATELTATLRDEDAAAAKRLKDQIVALEMQSENLWRGIASDLLPTLNDLLQAFNDGRKGAGLYAATIDTVSLAFEKAIKWTSQNAFGDPLANRVASIESEIKNLEKTVEEGPGLLERITGLDQTPKLVERIRVLRVELAGLKSFMGPGAIAQPTTTTAGSKPTPDYNPAGRAASAAADKKAEAEAIREAEKELRRYIAAANEAEAQRLQNRVEQAAADDVRGKAVLAQNDVILAIERETAMLGLSNDQRELAIALRSLETSGINKQDDAYGQLAARLQVAIKGQQDARARQAVEMREQMELLQNQSTFVGAFEDGLASFIDGTKSAKDAFKDFVRSVEQQLSRLAAQDIANAIFGNKGGGGSGGFFRFLSSFAGLFGGTGGDAGGALAASGSGWAGPYAKGGVFGPGGVHAFAMGDVFGSPTRFKFAGGMGVMGEAGPEAVMPLARDRSGRLGVRGGGTTVNQVTFNISTPDANSFRQSESQIAASMYQALSRSARSR